MATYVNDLRLKEIATGDESGTWGTSTNTNLELIGEAFSVGTEALSDASTGTITVQDGASDAARAMNMKLSGSLSQACTVTLAPNTLSKVWCIENNAGAAVTLTQGTGANVVIPNGGIRMVVTDGAGSGAAITDVLDVLGGTGNIALGSGAMGTALTTGTDNVAIGENALDAVTTGARNTAVGDNAAGAITTGADNIAVGPNALLVGTTGTYNVAVGRSALVAATTGSYNIAIGGLTLDALTTAENNIAIALVIRL